MEKVTGKEGKGAKGSTVSKMYSNSSIASLPKSSNASLGIDASVAAGSAEGNGGRSTSNMKTSKEMNSGASVKKSSFANFGIGDAEGKGGSAKTNAGRSAKEGKLTTVGKSIYPKNSRPQGTDGGGIPDAPGGSMARARRGLNQGDKS